MLKLADLRKTTRRTGTDGRRAVYPTFLRDRSLAPRIELAVRYLESMLGRPRRDLEQEVVIQLFGDHKLARCIVACLAMSYRHESPTFSEVLPADRVSALAEDGIRTASDLRLWVYGLANADHFGFVGAADRAPFLRATGDLVCLAPDQIEPLLVLDSLAQGILRRTGPVPTADDVIARFNHQTVMALLTSSTLVRLSLHRSPADHATILALCERAGVRASLSGRDFVLHGHQDALASWTRHGARLARLLALLLACGLPARSGEALVAAPTGEWIFRFDDVSLGYLGLTPPDAPPLCTSESVLAAWDTADRLVSDFAAVRRSGDADGWRLRRAPDPLVAAGVLLPSFLVAVRGGDRVPLIAPPSSPAAAARVRAFAARQPLAVLDPCADGALSPERPANEGDSVASLDDFAPRTGSGREAAAALPARLASAVARGATRATTHRIVSVMDVVASVGVLTEGRIAERLGCSDDDVAAQLGTPEAIALREAHAIRYVEGFGLCAPDVLAKAQAAAEDVARERGGELVGHAWTVRVLGRRLREVTGASEGIECLIAYLGAA